MLIKVKKTIYVYFIKQELFRWNKLKWNWDWNKILLLTRHKNWLLLRFIRKNQYQYFIIWYWFFLVNHHSNQFLCRVKSKILFQFNSTDDGEYPKSFCLIKWTYIVLFLPLLNMTNIFIIIACSYGYKIVCVDDGFSKPFKTYWGEDAVYISLIVWWKKVIIAVMWWKNILTKNL